MAENDTPNQQPTNEQPQPGSIIAPPSNQPEEPVVFTTVPTLELPSQPATPIEPLVPVPTAQQPPNPPPVAQTALAAPSSADPTTAITWTASEFIAHYKSPGWYAALAGSALGGAFLVWLITKDKISAAVVLFGALMLGIYGGRQPRQLQYQLDEMGLTIGSKYYTYDNFRSFSVIAEGAFSSIMFMPLKRFAPVVSIYYAPQDETAIIDLLAVRLPSEVRGSDPIDRLMTRIRF